MPFTVVQRVKGHVVQQRMRHDNQRTRSDFLLDRFDELAMQLAQMMLRRLQQLREEMVQRTAAMLMAAGGEAVRTLVALQKEPFPPATRLGAARAALRQVDDGKR